MASGLNPKARLITESLTVKLNSQANKMLAEGKNLINLTAGELDFATPAYIQREVRESTGLNKYTPTLGLSSLRLAITKLVTKDYKWKVAPNQVAVTAGAKQALFESLFAILKKDDQVIVPSPDWVTYRHQIVLNDAKPVIVPLTKKFDLDVAAIKRAITRKTKAIILNSPHNPTGAIFSKAALTKLRKLLKNKAIYMIVDDVYSKIIYDKNYKSPALFASDTDYLILINSFSKSQALTGWRIGYVVARPEIIEIINSFQSHSTGNASLLSQIAAEKIIAMGDKTDKFLPTLKKQRILADKLLSTIDDISYQLPQGAFYYFIDVSRIETNTFKFCERLLAKGLALVPGEAFGAPGFVRLSFSTSTVKLTAGIKIFKEFCDAHP